MPSESNPSRHRDFSTPLPQEMANAALGGFLHELMLLRNAFRIPDVHVIVRVNCINAGAEGGEVAAMTTAHYGDTTLSEEMCVWASAQAQAERGRLLGNMVAQGRSADGLYAAHERQQAEQARQAAGSGGVGGEPPSEGAPTGVAPDRTPDNGDGGSGSETGKLG